MHIAIFSMADDDDVILPRIHIIDACHAYDSKAHVVQQPGVCTIFHDS